MSSLSIGDLAATYQRRLQSSHLKSTIHQLTQELSSGKISDLRAHTRGNYNALASIEHQLGSLRSYEVAANEATLFASTLQTAFSGVQSHTEAFAPRLLEAAGGGTANWVDAASSEARARFSSVIATLNNTIADRALLGGTATGAPPLADSETMLADLMLTVAGETTAAGVEAAVNAWFDDPGGGFETVGYLGSDTPLAPFRVSNTETVQMDITAADQEIRDILKSFALAAVVDAGALPTHYDEQGELMRSAGEAMLTANGHFAALRGRVGSAEAAIDEAKARNASQTSALELALNEIVAADPYTKAVELEAAQVQLESLYALTARLSNLNLTEYLA